MSGLRGAIRGVMHGGNVGSVSLNPNVVATLDKLLVPQSRALTDCVGSGTATVIEGWLGSLPKAAAKGASVQIPAHIVQVLAGLLLEPEAVTTSA